MKKNFAYAFEILEFLRLNGKDRNALFDPNVYNVIKNDIKCPANLDEIIELIMSYKLEPVRILCFYKSYRTLRGIFPIKNFGTTATLSANHLVYESDVLEIFQKLHGPKHRKSITAMRVFRKEYDFYFPGFTSNFDSFVSKCEECNAKKRNELKRKKFNVKDEIDFMKLQIDELKSRNNNVPIAQPQQLPQPQPQLPQPVQLPLPQLPQPQQIQQPNKPEVQLIDDDSDVEEVVETKSKKQKLITIKINYE